jgi:hypothetical protein
LTDRITFVHANAESLRTAVAIEPYDLIYSFGVLHHTPNPARAARELQAYANETTMLKVMVYHRMSSKVLALLISEGRGKIWKLDEVVARGSEAQTGCPVTYCYSQRSARDWLAGADFAVTDSRVDHIFPYRVSEYVAYRYVKNWWWRSLPEPVFRGIERAFGWHLLLTAKVV